MPASKKVLAVFGATGNQGGSVINNVLADPELSQQFSIRALTRDTTKPAATSLRDKGVEVVSADVDDISSVRSALKGVHTAFVMTATVYAAGGKEKEIEQGKSVADAAVEAGVTYFIYSSMVSPTHITNGKLTQVVHFDSKNEVEQYLRQLASENKLQSSYFTPGSFMQNYQGGLGPKPNPNEPGTYALTGIVTNETKVPLIDVAEDTGKWVNAILADPDKYSGKVLSCATKLYSMSEIAAIMSKATGKKVVINQIPEEVYRNFLPKGFEDPYIQMMQLIRDYGYYGKDMERDVTWSAEQTRGKLTTFEDYLEKHPLKLE